MLKPMQEVVTLLNYLQLLNSSFRELKIPFCNVKNMIMIPTLFVLFGKGIVKLMPGKCDKRFFCVSSSVLWHYHVRNYVGTVATLFVAGKKAKYSFSHWGYT